MDMVAPLSARLVPVAKKRFKPSWSIGKRSHSASSRSGSGSRKAAWVGAQLSRRAQVAGRIALVSVSVSLLLSRFAAFLRFSLRPRSCAVRVWQPIWTGFEETLADSCYHPGLAIDSLPCLHSKKAEPHYPLFC